MDRSTKDAARPEVVAALTGVDSEGDLIAALAGPTRAYLAARQPALLDRLAVALESLRARETVDKITAAALAVADRLEDRALAGALEAAVDRATRIVFRGRRETRRDSGRTLRRSGIGSEIEALG